MVRKRRKNNERFVLDIYKLYITVFNLKYKFIYSIFIFYHSYLKKCFMDMI